MIKIFNDMTIEVIKSKSILKLPHINTDECLCLTTKKSTLPSPPPPFPHPRHNPPVTFPSHFSSVFCESHLQLLFTILERSPHDLIRANTIITTGDLMFRYPNLMVPWTPHLYARSAHKYGSKI